MEELNFQVLGPLGQSVHVVFRKHGAKVRSVCSCSTGLNEICQHRITLLAGCAQGIVGNNTGDVSTLSSWTAGTKVGQALHDVLHAAVTLQNATDDLRIARLLLVKSMRDSNGWARP